MCFAFEYISSLHLFQFMITMLNFKHKHFHCPSTNERIRTSTTRSNNYDFILLKLVILTGIYLLSNNDKQSITEILVCINVKYWVSCDSIAQQENRHHAQSFQFINVSNMEWFEWLMCNNNENAKLSILCSSFVSPARNNSQSWLWSV